MVRKVKPYIKITLILVLSLICFSFIFMLATSENPSLKEFWEVFKVLFMFYVLGIGIMWIINPKSKEEVKLEKQRSKNIRKTYRNILKKIHTDSRLQSEQLVNVTSKSMSVEDKMLKEEKIRLANEFIKKLIEESKDKDMPKN